MKELKNLASFVANISLDQVPEKAIQAAISCVYDSMAVAMGAKQDALYKSIQELYLKTEDVTHEQAELLGDGRKASLRTAVFLNAMIGHILEMDDVHTNSKTHIGTVVVPTAWTVARYLHKSGRAFWKLSSPGTKQKPGSAQDLGFLPIAIWDGTQQEPPEPLVLPLPAAGCVT